MVGHGKLSEAGHLITPNRRCSSRATSGLQTIFGLFSRVDNCIRPSRRRTRRKLPVKLLKPDPTNQISESVVAAERVEIRVGFQELQDIRLLLKRLLEPVESLFVIANTQVRIHKRTWGFYPAVLRRFSSARSRIASPRRPAWAQARMSTLIESALPEERVTAFSNTGIASAG